MRKTIKAGVNMCTVELRALPEVCGIDKMAIGYTCDPSGFSVRACRHFKPMKLSDGTESYGECEWFDGGCNCRKARAEAEKRMKTLTDKWRQHK